MIGEWVCLDSDCNKFGKELENNIFEFKKDIIINKVEVIQKRIDLSEYSLDEKIKTLENFGYKPIDWDIEDINWTLAECLFESKK